MYDTWDNIQGVSMKHFSSKLRDSAQRKPITDIVTPDAILGDSEIVVWLDLREITTEDIQAIQMRHVAVANKIGKYQGAE